MDIKVAFTSQGFLRQPDRAFSVTSELMTRLRIAQLEEFLFAQGIAPVDIDDLLARGR
jgi:hypothetical protein